MYKERLENEVLLFQKKAEKWKNRCEKLQELLKEKQCEEFIQELNLEQVRENDVALFEEEDDKDFSDAEEEKPIREVLIESYLADDVACVSLTWFTCTEFKELYEEMKTDIERTTWRGTSRKQCSTPAPKYSIQTMLFITLYWLAHYPVVSAIGALFFLHPRTVTWILKCTLAAMSQHLANEIRWPSDQEWEDLLKEFTFFQNDQFQDVVCVVDGTEIRVSRPSKEPLQRKMYSGKKKQHSLNVMFIVDLQGEIVFFSSARIGAHDQSHWNELNLRERFVNKDFGILGDGGFTFNWRTDAVQIRGYKPIKTPKGGTLTEEQKKYNKYLSQMRVVVENTIRRVKKWHILKGVYRHFWEKGQIDINKVLTVVVALANRDIKKNPIREKEWVSLQWFEVFA